MAVKQPVLTPPQGGETMTAAGGSRIEIKVESSQSGGDYSAVLWTVRAGEEPDPALTAEEKRITRARRAVDKAAILLAGPRSSGVSFDEGP